MEITDKDRRRLANLFARLADGGPEAAIAADMISKTAKRLGLTGGELQTVLWEETTQQPAEQPSGAGYAQEQLAEGRDAEPDKVIVACPHCSRRARVPKGESGQVDCPYCHRAYWVGPRPKLDLLNSPGGRVLKAVWRRFA